MSGASSRRRGHQYQPRTCERCGRVCRSGAGLSQHMKAHDRECACGCGEVPSSYAAEYVSGHREPESLDELRGRLFAKTDVCGDHDCWEWQGYIAKTGYGQIGFRGKLLFTHRASMLVEGHDIDGWWVLHKCDNRPCINPTHLYIGTAYENTRDVNERGEWNHPVGMDHPHAKLTDAEVVEIRQRYTAGESPSLIASEFGINRQYVRDLANRRWRKSA